jgi:hypothetical protein
MIKSDFDAIKELIASYPDNVLNKYVYREVPRQAVKETAVFGLPATAVENLGKVINEQLEIFAKNKKPAIFPISFSEYTNAIYSIVGLGYIATSGIHGNKDLFARYYQIVTQLFLKYGSISAELTSPALNDISRGVAQMINIALVAFNLTDYPHYFTIFKQSIKTLENSLGMFDEENNAIKEAKRLLKLMVY